MLVSSTSTAASCAGGAADEVASAHGVLDALDVPRLNPTAPVEVELTLPARIAYLAAFAEAVVADCGAA